MQPADDPAAALRPGSEQVGPRVVSSGEGRHVVGVFGVLDRGGLHDLQEQCLPHRVPPHRCVVLDFHAMTGCPSALFGALLRIRARLAAASVPLALVGLDDAVRAIVTGASAPDRSAPAAVSRGAATGSRPSSDEGALPDRRVGRSPAPERRAGYEAVPAGRLRTSRSRGACTADSAEGTPMVSTRSTSIIAQHWSWTGLPESR